MNKWVLTFGSGHHPWGNCYCIVEADTMQEARHLVATTIGGHWCSIYPIDELPEIVKYGGTLVRWKDVVMAPPVSAYAKELAE